MTTVINNSNVAEYVLTGVWTITGKVSEDEDAKKANDSTTFTLEYHLENIPLASVIHSSLKDKKITWQSGARKKLGNILDGAVIKVNYSGGAIPQDPVDAVLARAAAAGMTPAEYMAAEAAKRQKPSLEKLT